MDNLPLILSLETATLGGSVFLGRGTEELSARNGDPDVSQSASLLNDIREVLKQASASLREVDLFACASGPGSFTGLRIGIATLKALAASLNQPCVGIPTLQAVAHSGGPSSGTVALLPAGRGEVFAQLFSVGDDETVTELDKAAHLSPQRMVERYAHFKNLKWAGTGAQLQLVFLEQFAQQNQIDFAGVGDKSAKAHEKSGRSAWELAVAEPNLARHVSRLALQRFQSDRLESPRSLSAIYVRPSDAELNQQLCR